MATPVPYDPVAQAPGLRPTPSVGVNTPPAAFGVNVAEAASHLGQVVQGSGQELFDRAYAMQDLQVHADVNARLADMANKSMNLEADYSNLEGKNAVDGLPDFLGKLDKTRQEAGDGLSPIGQSYYDTESRNWRNRIAWSGVDHAKNEQKRYIVGSAQASMAADMKGIELNPDDAAANSAALDRIRAQADHISDVHGLGADDPARLMARNDAVNKAVLGQIRGLSEKGDFVGATKLFNQANADKEIYGEDSARMGEYIKWQRDLHGSRTVAGQVLHGFNGSGPVLHALLTNESGGRNIANTHQGTSSGQAQGFFQITTGTWRDFAPKAGVDLSQYPTPLSTGASQEGYRIQAQVASTIPLRRWDSSTIAAIRRASPNIDISKTLGENLAMNNEGFGAGTSSLADISAAARKVAYSQFPGDDDFADATESQAITKFQHEQAIRRDTDFNNDQAISSALFGGVGPQKKIPTTLEELQLDPNAKAAWDQMQATHPSMMRKYLDILAKNSKGDVAMTPERLNNWQTLYGESIRDQDEFMADTKDLSKLDLPRAQIMEIIRMQGEIYKKQDASPQITHAMSLTQSMLNPLGITAADNPKKRDLFVGVLHDVMEDYQQQNKKPMGDDDIRTAAQRLLNPVTNPGFFGHVFGKSSPWFESIDAVPNDAAEMIRQDYQSRGIQADDASILRDYLAAQFKDLYGKAAAPSGYSPQRYPQTKPNIKTFQ